MYADHRELRNSLKFPRTGRNAERVANADVASGSDMSSAAKEARVKRWRVWRVCAVATAAASAVAMAMSTSVSSAATTHGMEFDISLGYTHVELDGSASPFDSRDGFRVEPRFSW